MRYGSTRSLLLETLFMMTLPEHAYISSSVVRELAAFDGDFAPFLPPETVPRVRAFFEIGSEALMAERSLLTGVDRPPEQSTGEEEAGAIT